MKYSLVLFLLLNAFSLNEKVSTNNFFIDSKSIYRHKGKISLAFSAAVPFLFNQIGKYAPLKNKIYLLKKYQEWHWLKKTPILSFVAGNVLVGSYVSITNFPFTQNKTDNFIYPLPTQNKTEDFLYPSLEKTLEKKIIKI